jgi:hypothetical protein
VSAQERRDEIARARVAEDMFGRISDRRYGDLYATTPHDVLTAGIASAADSCARHLSGGNLGLAHAFARVHAALLASQRRMFDRWAAQREAKDAAESPDDDGTEAESLAEVQAPAFPDVLVHGRQQVPA